MILARNSITLHHLRDITTVVWYYKLQASTASPPAKPTTETPSGWTTTEPSYTEGSTNSLYVTQKTTFSDGTFEYSDVSLSTSYEAAKIAYNKAVVAQDTADAIPATVPGINLSPFFSHDLTDIYDANINPNGFWMDNGTSYGWTKNPKFTFTQLEDGWLHVHVDNSSGTATIRNDCCVPKYNPSIKRATKYTFLIEFRNNQSTGAASGADFYLVQQSGSVQFWGQNVSTAPLVHLEGIGGAISEIPSDGSYAFSRFTKMSESEGSSSHWTTNEKMVTFTFRANAGAVLDYDIRLSLYEGEYWGPYTPYVVSDTSAIRNAVDALQPELIVGTHGTTATATWTGTSTVLTEIKAGTRIQYKLSSAGASNVTLNLTLKNGTTTGAKNVFFSNTTRLGTQYGVNAIIDLIYDGTSWRVLNPYTNSNTVGTYGGTVKAGSNGVKNYSLVMRDTEATWVSLTTTAGTGATKARYTGGLYPDKVLYMGTNSAYAAGATTGTCYEALAPNLNYSTNSGSTLTVGKPVYLVGELREDENDDYTEKFFLDPTWWTQTIPNTENGKTYIYLGLAYSTSNIYLVGENTLYQYYEGAFRSIREIEEMKSAKTATNYLAADSSGIMVADMTDGAQYTPSTVPSGVQNTFIDDTSFQVRDGQTTLASFGVTSTIGKQNSARLELSDTSMQVFDANGSNNVSFGAQSISTVWEEETNMIAGYEVDGGTTITNSAEFSLPEELSLGDDMTLTIGTTTYTIPAGQAYSNTNSNHSIVYDGEYSVVITNLTISSINATLRYATIQPSNYGITATTLDATRIKARAYSNGQVIAEGGIYANGAGNFGLYDTKRTSWMMVSTADGTVKIPSLVPKLISSTKVVAPATQNSWVYANIDLKPWAVIAVRANVHNVRQYLLFFSPTSGMSQNISDRPTQTLYMRGQFMAKWDTNRVYVRWVDGNSSYYQNVFFDQVLGLIRK